MDSRGDGSNTVTMNERRAFLEAATLRETDHRDMVEVARWREAEAEALRQVLRDLRSSDLPAGASAPVATSDPECREGRKDNRRA